MSGCFVTPNEFNVFEGDLYVKGEYATPLRKDFAKTHRTITNTREFLSTLRSGPYAWPGGYVKFFVCDDGDLLSFDTARNEVRNILWAIRNKVNNGWRVIHCDCAALYENDLYDSHTGEEIA